MSGSLPAQEVHDQIAAALLEREEATTWLPVSITRDGKPYQGSYTVADGTIVVISRGWTVTTWVVPSTNTPILAKALLGELVRATAP